MYLTLLVTLAASAAAYPSGAPTEACNALAPQHGIPAQTTAAPYKIMVSSSQWWKTGKLNVTIVGERIGGFLLTARQKSDRSLYGTFEKASLPVGAKQGPCETGNEINSVTHTDGTVMKSNITFTWIAGTEAAGILFFQAAVVQEKVTFWVNITSADISETNQPTSQPPMTTSTAAERAASFTAILFTLSISLQVA